MEEWRSINNYKGLYEVSSYGKVRSINRISATIKGVIKKLKGKDLQLIIHQNGYYTCELSFAGKRKRFFVHHLVANAFLIKLKYKVEINHKNGIKNDNNIKNLEWITHSENIKHAYNTGLIKNKHLKDGK